MVASGRAAAETLAAGRKDSSGASRPRPAGTKTGARRSRGALASYASQKPSATPLCRLYNPHSLRRRSHAVQFNEVYPHGAAPTTSQYPGRADQTFFVRQSQKRLSVMPEKAVYLLVVEGSLLTR